MRGSVVPMDASVGATTVTSLTDETSQGVYCKRMRISALQCRQAWLGLCDFVFAQLKHQKGVSLPGLGSFAVGKCVDTANGGTVQPRAPVFVLSQKFDAVPQQRGRFFLTGPSSYARVSTTSIANRCGVHKAGVAHVLKEMIGQIAERVLDGEPVDVDFSFARLVANRENGTRVEMRFSPTFLEREMGLEVDHPVRAGAPRERTFLPNNSAEAKQRQMQICNNIPNTTPALETAAARRRAKSAEAATFSVVNQLAPVDVFASGAATHSASAGAAAFSGPVSPAVASRARPQSARKTPSPRQAASVCGAAFLEICATLDRLRVGQVERLRLERVLNDEKCAGLVVEVPVSVVRDTLRAASCGREGKFVAYLPVCRALEAATAAARAARAAARESAAARLERQKIEAEAYAARATEQSETQAIAAAAKTLAASAIANVVRGPFDPAEPIAEIFQARGGGARGVNQSEVIQFNKEYGKAVTSFVHASPGGVTPKVTSNRAVTLAEPLRETENELGRFLQRQIDYKETVKTAERQRRVADGELRIAEAVKSLEDEKLAIAKSKKQSTEALRAGWAEQRGARKTQSASGRPPVRLVKFDALK
jgi:nucleoid DNA-binding protein